MNPTASQSSNAVVRFLVSIGVCLLAGALGSLATTPNIPTWYSALEKPPLNPPREVFGPVWTTLYIMMGVALYLYWQSPRPEKREGFIAFGVQLALNTLWSIVFFGMQSPWGGVVVIVALIVAIIVNIVKFNILNGVSAWLLVPYLMWVLFATYLTVSIALLN